ncbi:MAG: glycosyltransferase, partial [Gammaproteobacteria bacterium]
MKTAILIPAYNEETTIGDTIDGFRINLPNAEIWVCDNNSSD